MANRILDEGLQRETRNSRSEQRVGDSEPRSHTVRAACLLDGYVLPDEIEFLSERDFVRLVPRECAAQKLAQVLDDTHGALAIVVAHKHSNRVECVEKKVRIELRLQRAEPGAGELLGESRYLHLTLARVDEVTRRMLDADDAEINRDTERQRDKDPTQPLNTGAQPKLAQPVMHCLVVKLRCEQSNQQHPQHLATRQCITGWASFGCAPVLS